MPSGVEHDVTMKGRKSLEVTGVSSVESFDVSEFFLKTTAGPLHIVGSNLHMLHLDLDAGVVIIEGTVSSLNYVTVQTKKKRLIGRLLR